MTENPIFYKKVPDENTVIICIPAYPSGPGIIYDDEITAFCGSCDNFKPNLYCKLEKIVDRQESIVRIGWCDNATVNGRPGTMTKTGFNPK